MVCFAAHLWKLNTVIENQADKSTDFFFVYGHRKHLDAPENLRLRLE